MLSQRRRTIAILCAGVAVAAGLCVVAFRNGAISTSPDVLLKRLPTLDAAVAGIDFGALRKGGYLAFFANSGAGAKAPQESEYTSFVQDTGFDYQRDLDYVLASFAPDGEFFLVKGTFDWPKLEQYALHQKGSCFDHLCRMKGSTADRNISFFPLKHNLMAMAVAPDDSAATRLAKLGPQGDIDIPAQPVWVSLSSGALRHSTSLPGSSKLLASAIVDANRVTLTLGPSGDSLEARLDAICRDAQQAGALTGQLGVLTAMLRTASQRQAQKQTQQESGADLAAFLTSGKFEQAGSHVMGRWPVPKSLLQSIASGI